MTNLGLTITDDTENTDFASMLYYPFHPLNPWFKSFASNFVFLVTNCQNVRLRVSAFAKCQFLKHWKMGDGTLHFPTQRAAMVNATR